MDKPRVLTLPSASLERKTMYKYNILLRNGSVAEILADSFGYEQNDEGDIVCYLFYKSINKQNKIILKLDGADVRTVANADEVDFEKICKALKRQKRKRVAQ